MRLTSFEMRLFFDAGGTSNAKHKGIKKRKMIDKNLTSTELAHRCGVSPSKMSFVLNNKQAARLSLIIEIQEVLGISDEDFGYYFLGGDSVS